MNYIFGLSTGCVYKLFMNTNDILDFYRTNFDINAVELTIHTGKINKTSISDLNLKWLSGLKHISYHLPDNYQYIIDVLNFLLKHKIEIDNFICHINNKKNIPKYFFNVFKDKILYENIENLEYNYEDVLNLCLDVSHSLKNYDMPEFSLNTVQQIHLSDYDDKKCHSLFSKNIFKLNMTIIQHYLEDLKKYKVIVENICESKEDLFNEIKYIKKYLYGETI